MLARILTPAGILCVTAACGGQADAPQTVGPEVTVMTLRPQRVMLVTELSGHASASARVEVRPQVTGTLLQRQFEEGTDVRAGQVLYQIDPLTYQVAFNSAKAALSLAEAMKLAGRMRARRAGDPNAIEQQDDDAAAAYKQAQADVMAARAALDQARIELAATRIEAPISGRIGRSTVTTGDVVVANGPTPLTTVLQIDPIYVELTASSTDILRLEQELSSGEQQQTGVARGRVGLRLPDGSVYARAGQLQFSEGPALAGTDSVTVRAVFPNPEGLLLPGMSVRVQVQEGLRNQALLVPRRSVMRDMTGHASVLVLGTHNRVEVRPVTLERMAADQWLIGTGLNAGERIVIAGFQRVRPGIPLTPAPSPANPPKAAGKTGGVVAATSGLRSKCDIRERRPRLVSSHELMSLSRLSCMLIVDYGVG
jgi:membrane fusion protein, multidrug efflux system